jgi:hypothetical protein
MSLKEAIDKTNKAIKKADEVAAKLTTKKRKQLPKTAFCGPDRSFPVHDCAHVRAAKTYLNRSRFSKAVRQRIAACINRKAKALGCPGTKPAKAEGAEEKIDKKLQTLMDSDIFASTKALVDQSIENEGMDLDFGGCEDCE